MKQLSALSISHTFRQTIHIDSTAPKGPSFNLRPTSSRQRSTEKCAFNYQSPNPPCKATSSILNGVPTYLHLSTHSSTPPSCFPHHPLPLRPSCRQPARPSTRQHPPLPPRHLALVQAIELRSVRLLTPPIRQHRFLTYGDQKSPEMVPEYPLAAPLVGSAGPLRPCESAGEGSADNR